MWDIYSRLFLSVDCTDSYNAPRLLTQWISDYDG